jgi:hypothetical protein
MADRLPSCAVCGRPARSHRPRKTTWNPNADPLCSACYQYVRAHGFDRSWELVENQRRRDAERCADHVLTAVA